VVGTCLIYNRLGSGEIDPHLRVESKPRMQPPDELERLSRGRYIGHLVSHVDDRLPRSQGNPPLYQERGHTARAPQMEGDLLWTTLLYLIAPGFGPDIA
jgi:hypothetical protein